jgi:hypothetical protein
MDAKRIAIMVLLVGGLVWAWFNSPLTKRFRGGAAPRRPVAQAPILGGGPTATTPPPTVVSVPSTGSSPASPLSRDELTRWRERYENAWRRDPFLTSAEEQALLAPKAVTKPKTVAPPAPLPSYKLKTILISETGKVAALDGRIVGEGERIGEERVVEIRPDGVVLERAGERRTISLAGGAAPITVTDSRGQGEKDNK